MRILLGQLIVRIAAGSQDPASVLKVLQEGAVQTATRARLRGLSDERQEEVRQYLTGSIERFFSAMRIEKGEAAKAGGAAGAPPKQAAAAPAKAAAAGKAAASATPATGKKKS
ncbi:MAG: hypothetical protein FJX64_00340 [Alphaproteobacteria bacterium]|nr:hypothetical protein [Alphaproteobacteria bacterium]